MKKSLITEMKEDLGMIKVKKGGFLVENILCDDEDFSQFGGEEDAPVDEPATEMEPEEEMPMDDAPVMGSGVKDDPAFTKIRQIAISELQKMADNPTSERYELLKRIWTMIDKASEDYVNSKMGDKNIQK